MKAAPWRPAGMVQRPTGEMVADRRFNAPGIQVRKQILMDFGAPFDAVAAPLLGLDERGTGARSPGLRREESRRTLEHLYALSKSAVLAPQCSQLLTLAVGQTRPPASTLSCFTQACTAVSVSSKSLATWPIEGSPRRHSSTISALNSGVNERGGRGFFFG
ncbi:hypothetical protein [Streptomyces sp. NPDC093097]|uniref:hypothetical protein n=1 Tax=Streptomyces sp. NPDC093097 TaxID=3366027 RepID=UPI0038257795